MKPEFEDLADVIVEEEKAAFANALAARISTIKEMPDGPVRARIYAFAALIGGAELAAELEGAGPAAAQLRRLADRLEANQGPLQ